MVKLWSVLEVLRWTTTYLQGKSVENPRLDAELLIGAALGKDRVDVYLSYDQPLQQAELDAVRALVKRRALREPLQYILGQVEFWALPFKVTPAVLIPRADTEILVEEGLKVLEQQSGAVLDVGTGSGAVAIALAHSAKVSVCALDISAEALQIAHINAQNNGVAELLTFVQADLHALGQGSYRLLVSNPPYITSAQMQELMPEVAQHEPELALHGGEDGLDAYRSLARQAPTVLETGGWIVVEVGQGQADAVADIFRAGGLKRCYQRCDYAGIARVVGACTGDDGERDG
ncbi:MAG: peptide chain release factor N(5)-glutamine methyltransferase [Desulfuromonadaceae bacterium]|nr:peptide chain release factor N(5)-glutamine methyltransferase [Desulfuromonadaceae bacterium]